MGVLLIFQGFRKFCNVRNNKGALSQNAVSVVWAWNYKVGQYFICWVG